MAQSPLNERSQEVLKENLPSLFETYKTASKITPSSWFVWDDKNVHRYYNNVCHAALAFDTRTYEPFTGLTDLVTCVPQSDNTSVAYQKMLIHGPFRSLSDVISLECENGNYYIHCQDLSRWPSNVLMNYCIATRIPTEYPQYLKMWYELCKDGYNPTLAFLLSYSTEGKWNNARSFPIANHFWLDPASDWKRIINGDMTATTEGSFFKSSSGTIPCNVIWGKSQDYVKIRKMLNEDISKYFGLPIVPQVAPKLIEKVYLQAPVFQPNMIIGNNHAVEIVINPVDDFWDGHIEEDPEDEI